MTEQPLTEKLKIALAKVDESTNMTRQQMEALGNQLGELYRTAEAVGDQNAMQSIMIAWEQAQALNTGAVQTNGQAVAIATIATDAIIQRDAIKDEYDKLDDALTEVEHKGFSSHPRIGIVTRSIRDTVAEEMYETGLHVECPGCESGNAGWMELIDHDYVNFICQALFGGEAIEISEDAEVAQKFADCINAAGDLIQQWYVRQRQIATVDLDAEPEE